MIAVLSPSCSMRLAGTAIPHSNEVHIRLVPWNDLHTTTNAHQEPIILCIELHLTLSAPYWSRTVRNACVANACVHADRDDAELQDLQAFRRLVCGGGTGL